MVRDGAPDSASALPEERLLTMRRGRPNQIVARLQIRHEASTLLVRPKVRCVHESHPLLAILRSR
jgi:hypothetical protein